ncbi:unnamed protein product, partial [Prorocentrum cordatum]
ASSRRSDDEGDEDEPQGDGKKDAKADGKRTRQAPTWPTFDKRMRPAEFNSMKRDLQARLKDEIKHIRYSKASHYVKPDKIFALVKDDGDVSTYEYEAKRKALIDDVDALSQQVETVKSWRQSPDSNAAKGKLVDKLNDVIKLSKNMEELIAGMTEVRKQQQGDESKVKRKETSAINKHKASFLHEGVCEVLAAEFAKSARSIDSDCRSSHIQLLFPGILQPLSPSEECAMVSWQKEAIPKERVPFLFDLAGDCPLAGPIGKVVGSNADKIAAKAKKVHALMKNDAAMIALGGLSGAGELIVDADKPKFEGAPCMNEISQKPFLVLAKHFGWGWDMNTWPFAGLPSIVVTVQSAALIKTVPVNDLLGSGLTALSALQQWAKANNKGESAECMKDAVTAIVPVGSAVFVPFGHVPFATGVPKDDKSEEVATAMLVFPLFPRAIDRSEGEKDWQVVRQYIDQTFETHSDVKTWSAIK